MSVSFTTIPTNPILKTGAKLTFALSGGGNFVRLWCTDAPLGSKLRQQLDESAASRVPIHEGEATASSAPFFFQPDAAGRYTLAAQEYIRGASTYGGGYAGDPAGFGSETKIGSETTTSVGFGQRVTMTMGTSPDTATLVLYVFGDSVQATTFALHGEKSPDIVNPSSSRAKTAALATVGAAAPLAGQTCATIVGNTDTVITGMMNNFTAHYGTTAGSVHAAADNYNGPSQAFAFPGGNKATIRTVAELMQGLTLHMNTDQARKTPFASAGIGTGNWHNPSGAAVVGDGLNTLIVPPPTTMEQAYVALADLFRAYEAHRQYLSVHGAADATNNLAIPPALMEVHREFLVSLAAQSPTAGATENPGVPVLIGSAGMKAG